MVTRNFTVDTLLELKDAGAVTSSAAAQVDSADKILDLGDAEFYGRLVVDVSAIDIASNDELYTIVLQGSNSATFASGNVELAAVRLGANEVLSVDSDSTTGRYWTGIANVHDDVRYRYVRAYHVVAGTSPSINYTARLAKE